MSISINMKTKMNKIDRLSPAVRRGIAQGVFSAANEVMNDSKENYVPVDTGLLRSSGRVDMAVTTANGVQVRLSYSGVAYALVVHEDPNAYHPHGQWKYLEAPIAKYQRKFGAMVSKAVEMGMKSA